MNDTTKFIKHISCLNTKNILDSELIVLSQKLLNTAFKNYFFEQNNLKLVCWCCKFIKVVLILKISTECCYLEGFLSQKSYPYNIPENIDITYE